MKELKIILTYFLLYTYFLKVKTFYYFFNQGATMEGVKEPHVALEPQVADPWFTQST